MKILIIEDEEAAAERLQKQLKSISDGYQIVEVLDSVEDTINWFLKYPRPDLIFMDVQLSDGVSFEIFRHVEIDTAVIFTTAYDHYAINAFKVNAIDYLLKPIKKEELSKAIQKAIVSSQPDNLKLLKEINDIKFPKRLLIKVGTAIKVIDFEEVAYFFSESKSTYLVNFQRKKYVLDYSLDKIEKMVDNSIFFRINRKLLVNFKAIDELTTYSKSRVKLKLTPDVVDLDALVSTERASAFKKWLEGEQST